MLRAHNRAGDDTAHFSRLLKQQLAELDPALLPLQQGLQHSSYALDDQLDFVLLDTRTNHDTLVLRVGIFYQGIVAGCSCADDPTPTDSVAESCEVKISIDRQSAETVISLLNPA
ncbi:MAG TPA: hypothetical protein ENJ11_07640 [Gammaproteobacteria bacterium]|nr:hypothetical protein [Gammaproteobacteria bacterium]